MAGRLGRWTRPFIWSHVLKDTVGLWGAASDSTAFYSTARQCAVVCVPRVHVKSACFALQDAFNCMCLSEGVYKFVGYGGEKASETPGSKEPT